MKKEEEKKKVNANKEEKPRVSFTKVEQHKKYGRLKEFFVEKKNGIWRGNA